MTTVRDTDGNEWAAAGVNALQQRQLRCISGARQGDVMLDPRAFGPPDSRAPAAQGGIEPDWLESWNAF